jgi:hypothetical protein
MEGMQYLEHRVVDGVYRAVMYWKIETGKVYIKEPDGWRETAVPVQFVKDFEFSKEAQS